MNKWEIIKSVSGLLIPVAIVVAGYCTSRALERMKANETRVQLYAQLMSKREEAESALRKDMLKSVIETFFKPESAPTNEGELEVKILNLELLAYNFHESVNLKPLFIHIKNQINTSTSLNTSQKEEYLTRLEAVARYVARKQLSNLELAGKIKDWTISFEKVRNKPNGEILLGSTPEFEFEKDNIKRKFDVYLQDVDPKTKELKVRVVPWIKKKPSEEFEVDVAHADPFWVGFFDFPVIDNTRLSHDQRYAVIINKFEESYADIILVCFPGTYGSLKEKPYYEDVVQNLLKTGMLFDESRAK